MRQIVATLQNKRGLDLVMLTGDHDQNARRIAEETGLTKYFANLKPEDKLHHIAQMAKTRNLAMVGDGINDAPALARATVGICMGKVGHTATMEAADVVLLQDNIDQLDWLFKKAHQTQTIVKQNLTLAAGAILIATIPALAGYIPLWLAVVLHEGGTVLVGLNGLRLLRR
jgi:P-type E1-E2 ATPase